jgi:hypothetical protein
MRFDEFVVEVDARLRARVPASYGLYQGPHSAFWQWGSVAARIREGMHEDAGLVLVAEDDVSEEQHGPRDAETATRFASAIADRFAAAIAGSTER